MGLTALMVVTMMMMMVMIKRVKPNALCSCVVANYDYLTSGLDWVLNLFIRSLLQVLGGAYM